MVIALIALLAALLLPALAGAKAFALRVKCFANLRQLGLATQMYWDDNGGNCFRYGGAITNGGQLYWFGWLGPGTEGQRAFDATQGALYPYLRGRGVEICPAFEYFQANVKLKANGATYGYGYNLFLSAPETSPPVKMTRLSRPAGTALLADAAQVNTWQAPASAVHPMLEEWYYVDDSTNQPNCHFRHAHRASVLFVDTHVGLQTWIPGSIDPRLPQQFIGRLPNEVLHLDGP